MTKKIITPEAIEEERYRVTNANRPTQEDLKDMADSIDRLAFYLLSNKHQIAAFHLGAVAYADTALVDPERLAGQHSCSISSSMDPHYQAILKAAMQGTIERLNDTF